MLQRFEITTSEQAKVLTHPLRLQIISLFSDGVARTSKQISDVLERSPSKVHYHVRELLRAGLLELVETKEKGGVIEKYYLPVAKEFKINLNEMETSKEEILSTRFDFLKVVIQEYQGAFIKALTEDEKDREQMQGSAQKSKPFFQMSYLLLDEEEIKQLNNEVVGLLETWMQKSHQRNASDGEHFRPFGLLLSHFEHPNRQYKGSKKIQID